MLLPKKALYNERLEVFKYPFITIFMFSPVDPKISFPEREKKTVKFWKKNKIFEKSIENRREAPIYSFFDGPPFISGVPHYGTILSSVSKDVVPRYFTMRGFRVDRRWGWDCHGLPAEHMVEGKLGIKTKNEIETKFGIERFVCECQRSTSKIASSWEDLIDRIGRWVDYENPYRTMDKDYMESIWWAFKELFDKGYIYKDTRISLYCPRCETPLANFEIAMDNSYQDVSDTALFVKFPLKTEAKEKLQIDSAKKAFFIAWTTTPWTLLSNSGLAVNPQIEYLLVEEPKSKEVLILAKSRFEYVKEISKTKGKIIEEVKGSDLLGLNYERILEKEFSYEPKENEDGFKVVGGDFVESENGSGIVHLSPSFGEEDYKKSKEENLPILINVNSEGKFTEGTWEGENIWEANPKIIESLRKQKIILAEENITHSYPFCHRCHTKLIYKVQPAWFIKVNSIKEKLISENEKINWHPEHLKHGRFLKGIESAPDWNISRDRYFGTAIPIWECENCQKQVVVGSYEELYQLSGQRLDDYHRPYVDKITFKCPDCESTCKRIPQVLDCWVESAGMPFAERHYPFKNQEDFNQKFPADFISEYLGQTRAWFFVMHIMSVALFDKPAFKNVVTTGVIAGSDGRKMSKSLKNYTDPNEILEKYSADALRFYLMSSPIMEAENLSFSDEKVAEVQKGMLRAWLNSYYFFVTYARLDKWKPDLETPFKLSDPQSFREAWKKPEILIDAWILSELHFLIKEMRDLMDNYKIAKAARLLPPFLDKLSNWYIRRSRKRFWKSENDENKNNAYQTLYEVLTKLGQSAAPFLPFLTEEIYQNINVFEEETANKVLNRESIHLTDYPEPNPMLIDENLNLAMERVRKIVTLGLSLRAKKGIKVRQPLGTLFISDVSNLNPELQELVKDELNIKEIKEKTNLKELLEENKLPKNLIGISDENEILALDTELNEDLLLEGEMREIVRQIQEARKKSGFQIEDKIVLGYLGKEEIFNRFGYLISKEVLAEEIFNQKIEGEEHSFEIKLGEEKVKISMKRKR